MNPDNKAAAEYRPLFLDESDPEDARRINELRAEPGIEFTDLRDLLRTEFEDLVAPPKLSEGPEVDRWIYYPWRHAAVALPGPELLRTVRLDRNRNKLTRSEQEKLAQQTIGVVGQSVGHAIAHTLAMEGSCGRIKLADFDTIELANLNRIPGSLFDIGVNKAVVTARRIAEIDPYLPVEIFEAGLTDENVDDFFAGLTVVVEECDSLDIKLAVREAARRYRIPLLMETSDRGLLDIERYDLEPEREPFHGLLGGATRADLRGLTTREKAPFVVRILDAHGLSDRFAASLVEIDQTLDSWPQLASDVQLGGATVAAAVRRIGLGGELPSGRTRIDLTAGLDAIAEPASVAELEWPAEPALAAQPGSAVEAVLAAAQLAPSGGNVQPWSLRHENSAIVIELDVQRSSGMDIGYRGSAVAVGAALYNARAAAAARGVLGEADLFTGGTGRHSRIAPLTAVLHLSDWSEPELARDYPDLLTRVTNRKLGNGEPLDPAVLDTLGTTAAKAGGGLRWVTDAADLATAATLLAASDQARYLTPRLHAEMFSELRWPSGDLRTGLDLRTMELAPDELAKLDIAGRADVMDRIRDWNGGIALGEYTRDRVLSASALCVVTFPAPVLHDPEELTAYAHAGETLQRVWIEAQRQGLAVQPVSPVFLYVRQAADLSTVSTEFADTLTSLQGRFLDLLGVPEHETVALVLRLSYAAEVTVRSRRLPTPGAEDR
ncbi:MAG: Rv1355c family protein [Nocardia sp.]|uniref:Rv1355c family protein n=1 Tax=Nocardia sp. TaxID=1821 RepID=UPI00261173CD|nr:Rv1355c family protein [Nocardia sp.]MCU1645340.1 Rv1355c family protein [Nocardia sp.]